MPPEFRPRCLMTTTPIEMAASTAIAIKIGINGEDEEESPSSRDDPLAGAADWSEETRSRSVAPLPPPAESACPSSAVLG